MFGIRTASLEKAQRGSLKLLSSAAVLIAVAAAVGWLLYMAESQTPVALYVGSKACASCHQAEHQAWQGSHHQLAMQSATRATVLAPFKGERFTEAGVTTTFTERASRFFVRTEGEDGRMQEFEVTHTLGLAPLQQYLIPMPTQGMQAFTVAWDARPLQQGGQRWFHLHADQHIKAGEALHWTGRQNNWNFMCAECHVTQFKKNFDPMTRSYSSRWSEIGVSCESCHGPGSNHLTWAGKNGLARLSDASHGLAQWLDERKGVQWVMQSDTGNAKRSVLPGAERKEVELCARCHAHRSQLSDDYVHGQPLLDTHVPSLVEKDLFWVDGQMRAEVYNYASFEQSKMFQKGVTCSDCHNPHTQKIKAPGNQVCWQCHAPAKYDAPAHHFHPMGSAGASCAACHMPTTTYMAIDPRHDHSLRVPRPDLSVTNGTPNACTQCHADKPASWAARWATLWYPALQMRVRPLDQALHLSDAGDAQALALLFKIINDTSQAPIVRASALQRASTGWDANDFAAVQALLADRDPLMRRTAVESLSNTPPELRARALPPMLSDPVRAVRLSALRWLAGVSQQDWSAQQTAAWSVALNEYIAVQQFNADRPESFNNLGTLYADMGDWPKAEASLRQAIAIDPQWVPSLLNLADVYRAQGNESQAEATLRKAIASDRSVAVSHYALGLLLLRQKRNKEALLALKRASDLAPEDGNIQKVYAAAVKEFSAIDPEEQLKRYSSK